MIEQLSPPLVSGQKLSREEFLRRWEAMPHIKKAELIAGIVYMPSPVGPAHCSRHNLVGYWLRHYAVFTPGCDPENDGTWLMLEDAPQPDAALRILPEYGGQSRMHGGYLSGAPELAAEVCESSASYDLGPKLKLYRAAGVQEYVAVVLGESKVLWHRLIAGEYTVLDTDAKGMLRSHVFPGLWLDPHAVIDNDGRRILDVLSEGLKSPEHERFVEALARRKSRKHVND